MGPPINVCCQLGDWRMLSSLRGFRPLGRRSVSSGRSPCARPPNLRAPITCPALTKIANSNEMNTKWGHTLACLTRSPIITLHIFFSSSKFFCIGTLCHTILPWCQLMNALRELLALDLFLCRSLLYSHSMTRKQSPFHSHFSNLLSNTLFCILPLLLLSWCVAQLLNLY